MTKYGKYTKYLFLCSFNNREETPSWMVDGLNRKMYFEALNRAVKNLPSNPTSEAGVLGREAGTKKLKLLRLVTGEQDEDPKDMYDFDEDIPF